MRTRGFTLIEVALSLAIVSVAVVTIFMLLPVGIRTQNTVRYQVLAAAKAMEMLDQMRNGVGPGVVNDSRDLDKEGVFPWDSPVAYKVMAPDLEAFLENTRGTIKPLPEKIAERIDSDHDEIRALLDAGGRLYYFFPGDPVNIFDAESPSGDAKWDPLYRKLLVGVVGAPQHNTLLYHPSVKLGPYQATYPSPPTHGKERPPLHADGRHVHFGGNGVLTHVRYGSTAADIPRNILYEALCRDPAIATVMLSDAAVTYRDGGNVARRFGFKNYSDRLDNYAGPSDWTPPYPFPRQAAHAHGDGNDDVRLAAQAYVAATLWYAQQTGLDTAELFALTLPDAETFARAHSAATDWRQVLALRYLAHAGLCLTRWHDMASAVTLDARMVLDGVSFGGQDVTLETTRAWHEAALAASIFHADRAGPYHWGAPRPLNRQVMMDHPLVELDVFSSPILAVIRGERREQWRAVYPQAPRQPGAPFSFPGRLFDTNRDGVVDQRDDDRLGSWWSAPARILDRNADGRLTDADRNVPTADGVGQPAVGPATHSTILAPFAPQERCRELVFWAVDWQSWRDFETCPSAAIDAARFPIVAPMPMQDASPTAMGWNSEWNQRTARERQLGVVRVAGLLGGATRNPELVAAFREPSEIGGRPASAPLFTVAVIGSAGWAEENLWFDGWIPDLPFTGAQPSLPTAFGTAAQWNMRVFLGRFGVNRNNVVIDQAVASDTYGPTVWSHDGARLYPRGRADAGPVPPTVRLRATTVARFPFYDLRIQTTVTQ